MKKIILLASLAACMLPLSVSALPAQDFSLAGFKPGMTAEQALEQATVFTEGKAKMLNIHKGGKNKDGEALIRTISAKKGDIQLRLEFLPIEQREAVLYKIIYSVPKTQENLLQAAYSKFGDPKIGEKNLSASQKWCEQLNTNERCSGPTLEYFSSSSSLTLSDQRYADSSKKVKIEL